MIEQYPLPDGWRWVRLGKVCEVEKGKTPKEFHYADVGFRIIKYRDIKENKTIDWEAGFRSYVSPKYSQTLRPLLPKTTLIGADAHDPSSIGKKVAYVEYIPSEIKLCYYSGELIGIRVMNETVVDHWWPFYWFASENGYQIIQTYVDGVHLNKGQAVQIPIPLPPIKEQRRIATRLQELMKEVERARSACEKQLEATTALPPAYLREVFESDEAKKWERKALGEVLEIIESGSRPKGGVFEIKEGILSIGAEHLNSFGGFNFDNMRFIPKEFYGGMRRGKIQKGDVLVVKDGATTGKVSFVEDDFPYAAAAINEHVFRLRGKGFLQQEFLFWFLYSPTGQIQIQQQFHGSAQGGINQQFVNGVIIPIPSISIQRRIAAELKEKMAYAEKLRQSVEKQLSAMNALPQAILRKAFRGEL